MNTDDAPKTGIPGSSATPEPELKQIRTFQGDVAEAIRSQQESLYTIQHAEKKKKDEVREKVETEQKVEKIRDPETQRKIRSFLFLLGTVLLVGLGGVGIYFGYQEFRSKTTPPSVATPNNRFIRATAEAEVDATHFTRESLVASLLELERSTPKNGLVHIVLKDSTSSTTPLLTTKRFLEILNVSAPPSLVRALDPLFMFGLLGREVGDSVVPSTFILVKLDSFENAFSGMLAWEKTLASDIGQVLATRTGVRNISPNASFEDITIRNKDARILRDTAGNAVMLYSFFENNMLVITDNEETFRSIITRLTNEKLER